jgi:ubiquinone/menaquinone biosynthesis C-methylase UbiE
VSLVLRWSLRRAERAPDPAEAALHAELLGDLAGVVVEVGCGRGRIFERYPSTVGRLVAVEPDADLRAAAALAASRVPFPVEVVDGVGERLPLPDGSADAVVFSEVLCSVPDQRAVLAEARRVLRPGGQLRVFEHVAASSSLGRGAQRTVDRVIWSRLLGGCETSRETARAVQEAGFTWQSVRRCWSASSPLFAPAGPHILGTAVALA